MIRNALLIISSRTHHWVSLRVHCSPLWMLTQICKNFFDWTVHLLLKINCPSWCCQYCHRLEFFILDYIMLWSDWPLSWQKDALWPLLPASDNFSLNIGIPTIYEGQLEAANALQHLSQLLAMAIRILSRIYIFGRVQKEGILGKVCACQVKGLLYLMPRFLPLKLCLKEIQK